jgi:hypothetical protein
MTALTDPFPPAAVLHFEGRGGKTFDYIEDESVMDRLDECVGAGNWSIKVEPISVADGIVKVTLETMGATFEDFGYQNRADGEALKEAVSDGIRRVGRMVGIGRYLYRKHDSPGARGTSSARPVTAVAPPGRPAAATIADPFPEHLSDLDKPADPLVCATHGTAWTGNPGDLWHGPKGIVDGGYCRHPQNTPKARR